VEAIDPEFSGCLLLQSPEHRRGRYDHASIRGILDNDGVRLGEYLTELRAIPPKGSATYVVSQSDRAGGIGANFLVEAARRLQLGRFKQRDGLYANGQMGARDVRKFCDADETGLSLLRSAMARFGLSARSFHRVLKIARTIADLAESEVVRTAHVAEALQFRGLDRSVLGSTGS
jgi:magnesium chelatase family protein